ncbi:hypothetical protein NS2R_02925 [Pseudomonas oryzihabitans]|nr:hypothetical protein NS2R_02925 [Pseudomonas psychrotolerans]
MLAYLVLSARLLQRRSGTQVSLENVGVVSYGGQQTFDSVLAYVQSSTKICRGIQKRVHIDVWGLCMLVEIVSVYAQVLGFDENARGK